MDPSVLQHRHAPRRGLVDRATVEEGRCFERGCLLTERVPLRRLSSITPTILHLRAVKDTGDSEDLNVVRLRKGVGVDGKFLPNTVRPKR